MLGKSLKAMMLAAGLGFTSGLEAGPAPAPEAEALRPPLDTVAAWVYDSSHRRHSSAFDRSVELERQGFRTKITRSNGFWRVYYER